MLIQAEPCNAASQARLEKGLILAVIFQTVNYLAFVKHEIAALVCPWECQLCKHQIYFFLVNTTEPILNGLLVTLWDGIPYHTIWHKKSSFQDSPTTSNRNMIVMFLKKKS